MHAATAGAVLSRATAGAGVLEGLVKGSAPLFDLVDGSSDLARLQLYAQDVAEANPVDPLLPCRPPGVVSAAGALSSV